MPFGLDFKSIIVGVLIAYFLVPRLLAFVGNVGNPSPNA
jgi:hypothetical protein